MANSPAASLARQQPPPAPEPEPFRFGWRYVKRSGPDGEVTYDRIALTPADVLHPLEHDEIPDNTQQALDCAYLYGVLRWRLAPRPGVLVLTDCLIHWGVPGLGNHSPDISIFDGVTDRERLRSSFRVRDEHARPLLNIEIVSPDRYDARARNNDVVAKVEHYERAGVPLYAIVDQEEEEGPRQILGYRLGKRKYSRMPLDAEGRLPLEPFGLLLGLRDNKVVCWDAVTGQEIADYPEAMEARVQAELALQNETQARQQAEAALAAALTRLAALESQAGEQRPHDSNR